MEKIIKPPVGQHLEPGNWVKAYADYLYAYAITRINDKEQARDLVQETFLAGLQSRHQFAGKSTERTWLTAILKNKIIDIYRKRSSLIKVETLTEAEEEKAQHDFFNESDGHWIKEHQPLHFNMDDHDPLVNKEFNQVLQRCMMKMPGLWLSVFTMKHMDDEATDLICTELKISQANFWVIIHRAKLNLRACLQKNWM